MHCAIPNEQLPVNVSGVLPLHYLRNICVKFVLITVSLFVVQKVTAEIVDVWSLMVPCFICAMLYSHITTNIYFIYESNKNYV